MRRTQNHYGWLFRLASGLCKYYGLFLLGLIGVGILALILGWFPILKPMYVVLGGSLWRLLVSLIALWLISVVFESFRY